MPKPTLKIKPRKPPNQLQAKAFPGGARTQKVPRGKPPGPITKLPKAVGVKRAPRRPVMGAPLKEFNYDMVEDLAAIGLTTAQIADALCCSTSTVFNRKADDPLFADAFNRGKARMQQTLAGGLFKLAEKRDRTCLIYLSKVHLKWSEWQQPPQAQSPEQLAQSLREEMAKLDGSNDVEGEEEGEEGDPGEGERQE